MKMALAALHSLSRRSTLVGWARVFAPTSSIALLATVILLMAFGGALAQPDSGKPLIVGSEEDFPPFALGKTDETAGGFTVELWKAVAAESGLNYTIRVRPFRQILDEFKNGKIDVLINLAQSRERHDFADFSVPHVVVNGAIFVRKGESRIRSEADFAGKSIIALHSDLAHDYAVSKGWEKQLVLVDTAADGLKLLASGQHDAMLLSKLSGMQTLLAQNIRTVKALETKAGFSQKFCFAVHKGNADLLAKINEALALTKSTGRYDALYEKWLGVFEAREVTFRDLLKYLGPIAVGLLIFMGFLLVRQRERKKSENRLRDSEERLRLAMSAAHQGLYDLNVQTGECIVSPEYATMLGYDPAKFHETNAAWRERLHPEDREPVYTAYSDYVAGKREDYRVEFRQRTKAGDWKWILSLGSLVERAADGRPLRMLGTHTDITERKRAEDALRASEERFQHALEATTEGVWDWNIKTGAVQFSPQWVQSLGYTLEEVPATVDFWKSVVHPEDMPRLIEALQAHFAGRIPVYECENRLQKKSGEYRHNLDRGKVVEWDADGRPLRMVGTDSDITARKEADRALGESEARFRTLFEQAAVGVAQLETATGQFRRINRRYCDILGYSVEEMCGLNFQTITHPDDLQLDLANMRRLVAGEIREFSMEKRHFRKDGNIVWVQLTVSPMWAPGARPDFHIAVVLDISARKETELALRESEKRLRESQKLQALGQLAGGVAHDFNNILLAMIMQAELSSMRANLPGEAREGFERILDYAQRAANLVRQLLLFSSRQLMQRRELDLNEAVTHIATMFQRVIGEDVHLELELFSAPLITRADAGMLDQVLVNLALNARDAMPEGGRLRIETAEKILDELGARAYPDAAPGRYVWLSVSDTGRGIPPEVLPRIFEPFFTTKEQGKGTGLGLATVFGIVRQHRGWLTVSSTPGRGANFQVFLPASEATLQALPEAAAIPAAPRGTEIILLVEDELAVRTAACEILQRHGYRVLEAADGLKALDLWQKHRGTVALLLTDMVMPGGMSGQQLAQRLRAEQPGLRVVIMSGYSAEIAGRELKLPTGENFLEKPFASDQLLETIRRCLDA